MMNIGVGSIITKGLGGPACNLMIFGAFRLYIEPFVDITPTPTPAVGGGGGTAPVPPSVIHRDWEDEDEDEKFKLTFVVKFRSKEVKKSFIVDSFKKDKIIKHVGQINILNIKFKTLLKKIKENRFIVKWK